MLHNIIFSIFVMGLGWSSYQLKAEALPVAHSFCNAVLKDNAMENQNEIWKDIIGYEGLYQISNLGRVKSLQKVVKSCRNATALRNERIIKTDNINGRYINVELSKNSVKKNYLVHRLVLINFIPNPENKPCVNHINGNKKDNRVENLEWCTYQENIRHSFDNKLQVIGMGDKNKLSKKIYQYSLIENKLLNIFNCGREVELYLGIKNSRSTVQKTCLGKYNSAYGFIWKYEYI